MERFSHSFPTMGTVATIICEGCSRNQFVDLSAKVENLVTRFDHLFSRFNPESDISRLNERFLSSADSATSPLGLVTSGVCVNADFNLAAETGFLLRKASFWAEQTSGLFRVQQKNQIDFGGIAKGFAADQAKNMCIAAGVDKVLVNIGSSSLSASTQTDGLDCSAPETSSAWRVGIRSCYQPIKSNLGYVLFSAGSLSFSGDGARLLCDKSISNHIVDPRTGKLAVTDVGLVGVSCLDGIKAEVLSTTFLILGSAKALQAADMFAVGILIFTTDGRVLANDSMREKVRLSENLPAKLDWLREFSESSRQPYFPAD